MIGQTINSYRIMEEVAAGGFGTLYRAEHLFLNRVVAFKVLHPHHTKDALFLSKFRSEGQFLAQLEHPNIVKVHDAGQDRGYYWLAMEWLDGKEVKELIQTQKQLPISLAVSIAEQVATALEYAHAKNLIHRDIKPANLMLLPSNKVIVLDFGVATIVEAGRQASTVVGSQNYMPYEQWLGKADHRSDLYALGVTLYQMLTGQLPPRLASAPPTPPRQLNAAIPRRLEQFLYRTLAQDPNQRPQSATAFREELLRAVAEPAKGTQQSKSGPSVKIPQDVVNKPQENPAPQKLNFGFKSVRVTEFTGLLRGNNFEPRFAWSPDGNTLAFTAPVNNNLATAHLYLLDFSQLGQDPRTSGIWGKLKFWNSRKIGLDISIKQKQIRLTPFAQNLKAATRPVWSPDGQQVIYVSTDEKIWGVSKNGRINRIMLDHTVDDPRWWPSQMLPPSYKSAAWSPNRQFLAVLEEDNVSVYSQSGEKMFDVNDLFRGQKLQYESYYSPNFWVTAGTIEWLNEERLVVGAISQTAAVSPSKIDLIDIKMKTAQSFFGHANFVISPNRQWIAIGSPTGYESSGRLLISTNDYSNTKKLPIFKGDAFTVWSWSPNSTKLLFTLAKESYKTSLIRNIGKREISKIYLINTNKTGLQQLADGYAPHWSPDGRHIAFLHSPQEQVYDLWVMGVEPGSS